MSNIRTKVVSGLFWKFAERAGAEIVAFVVQIILARLMLPSDFGTIALVTVFINLANVFVNSGFGISLIQKKEVDNIDFSTIFFFNIGFSVLFYTCLFLFAPTIANFYEMPILKPVLRVLGIQVIIAAINNVQQSYVSRNMQFKKFFFATLVGTLLSAAVGIFLALAGMGVWALVFQYLTNTTVGTLMLWFTVKWRPSLVFQWKRLKNLFSYGWKIMVSAMLDTGYNELRSLLIGKLYTSSSLAYYNKGTSFPNIIIANINTSISGVLFPAIAQEQSDLERVKNMTRRSIKISSYIIVPAMVGLAAVSKPLITLLLTDKWLPCVIFLQLSCITYALRPMSTANLEAIKALGRSDIFLKLEIIKKIFGIILLVLSIPHGIISIAISGVITSLLSTVINCIPNKKILNYGYFQQLSDISSILIISLVMGACIWGLNYIITAPLLLLITQVVLGILIYLFLSWIFKLETFTYLLSFIKQQRKH